MAKMIITQSKDHEEQYEPKTLYLVLPQGQRVPVRGAGLAVLPTDRSRGLCVYLVDLGHHPGQDTFALEFEDEDDLRGHFADLLAHIDKRKGVARLTQT